MYKTFLNSVKIKCKITIAIMALLFFCDTGLAQIEENVFDFVLEIKDSVAREIKYGFVEVPLTHDGSLNTKIDIAYLVLKSPHGTKKSPLIYFSGGPGSPTITSSSINIWSKSHFLLERDIILFDQRGLGLSSSLPNMGPELFKIMAMNLDSKAELVHFKEVMNDFRTRNLSEKLFMEYYNSFEAAKDVKFLMDHLNYEKYHLYGKSYGTRLARIVQDMFPEKIENVILDSPAPLEYNFLISTIEGTSHGLGRLFSFCKEDEVCSSKYPNLEQDYLDLLTELAHRPIEVLLTDEESYYINPQDVIYFLRRSLYSKESKGLTPKILEAIQTHDDEVLINFIEKDKKSFSRVNLTLLLAVESHSRFNLGDDSQKMEAAYAKHPYLKDKIGFFNAAYHSGKDLHDLRLDEKSRKFKKSKVPTWIFVNEYDPATPPTNGDMLLEDLENGTLFVLDAEGHGIPSDPCIINGIHQFLDNPIHANAISCSLIIRTASSR